MYEINQEDFPQEFVVAWQSARLHIQSMGQDGVKWVRSNLFKPVAEHLSFLLGNQLIFVFIEVEGVFRFANNPRKLFLDASREAKAIPCLIRMERGISEYRPKGSGWGFVHAVSGQTIDPPSLVTDELIEISDWELHDMAISVVRNMLEKEGKEILSWQSALRIDPSIWFRDRNGLCWVVVRTARYPIARADMPANITSIGMSRSKMSDRGYFASVCVSSTEQETSSRSLPLYRGHGYYVNYKGLEPV